MNAPVVEISSQQQQQYRDEGYFIVEDAMPESYLATLRVECEQSIDRLHQEMDEQATDTIGISHRGKRYFIAHPSLESDRVRAVLFSDVFADICQATIGDEAYAYWEQYVVKAAEQGMEFGWHQDSGFEFTAPHPPYITCWCPLDDVSPENGTIYVLPYSRAGTRDLLPHRPDEATGDLIGYDGDDPGDPVEISAGSIAVFSSHLLHRSGRNTTDRMRRTYLAQFAPQRMFGRDGKPAGRNEPFLKNGRRVIA